MNNNKIDNTEELQKLANIVLVKLAMSGECKVDEEIQLWLQSMMINLETDEGVE